MHGVKDIIDSILMNVFKTSFNEHSLETKIKDLPSWNSLKHMELIAALEKELNTELSFDQILKIQTLQDVTTVVEMFYVKK